jgi:hypothetical protein
MPATALQWESSGTMPDYEVRVGTRPLRIGYLRPCGALPNRTIAPRRKQCSTIGQRSQIRLSNQFWNE